MANNLDLCDSSRLLRFTKNSSTFRKCNCELFLDSVTEFSLKQGSCQACETFFYLGIQNFYPKTPLGYKVYQTKPLFQLIFSDFKECEKSCNSDYCLLHLKLFIEKFETFFSSDAAPFPLSIQIKSSLSPFFYCLSIEYSACKEKHTYCKKHPGLSRWSLISEVLHKWEPR